MLQSSNSNVVYIDYACAIYEERVSLLSTTMLRTYFKYDCSVWDKRPQQNSMYTRLLCLRMVLWNQANVSVKNKERSTLSYQISSRLIFLLESSSFLVHIHGFLFSCRAASAVGTTAAKALVRWRAIKTSSTHTVGVASWRPSQTTLVESRRSRP